VFLYPPKNVMVNSLLKFRYFNHPMKHIAPAA
jgi:hypothetical protein